MPNRIFYILFLLVVCSVVSAQPKLTLPNYKHYTLREGLSQMQVLKLFQDSRGYIWIGTKAGLNCFNGEKFISYTEKKNNLISDYIFDIVEDKSGKIWASTLKGIFSVNGASVQFFDKPDWSNIKITADNDGRIWYLATNESLKKYCFGYIIDGEFFELDNMLQNQSLVIHSDLKFVNPENRLVLSLDSVLYAYKTEGIQEIFKNDDIISFIPNNKEKCYFINSNDVYNFKLHMFQNGCVKEVANIQNGKIIEQPLLEDTLFFVTNIYNSLLVRITPDTIQYDLEEEIHCNYILLDINNRVWVGSEDGLYQLFGKEFTIYNKDYLPQVWAITEDLSGNMWFSSFMFGLSKLERGKLTKYPNSPEKEMAYYYFQPSVDKRGQLFFPNGYGILKINGNRFVQKSDYLCMTTYYDSKKDLLLTGSKKRVNVFGSSGSKIRTIDESKGLDVGNLVLTISQDNAGFFWFGGGKGVARYDWGRDKLINYNTGIGNTRVGCICTDFTGRTWFGSKKGLLWYNDKTNSIEQLHCEELSESVNMLSVFDSTWLIVSQPYGIYLFDLQEYYRSGNIRIHLFNEKNGFMGIEPGQDGAFTDSKGNIWMTTSTEVVMLDPKKLKKNRVEKNFMNLRINKCNGNRLDFDTEFIELPINQNTAIITFETICFNRPNPVQYSWKLETNTIWSAWQEEDYAVVNGLSEGNVKIMVRAKIKGLPMSELAQASIRIKVKMAIYRQPWFLPTLFSLISFVGITILILSIFRMRKTSREARIFQIQAIQSQMNPHFIFNVLASLQSMIMKANISKANDYLVKLADLIRGFLEASAGTGVLKSPNSQEGKVSVAFELKLLQEFVEFQQLINPNRFEFEIKISENIEPENTLIPPMLLQPFIENSIRHGLLPSKQKGFLLLSFNKANNVLEIEIRDNGIGIEQAKLMMNSSTMRYISRGSDMTMSRINLLNQLGFKIEINTESDNSGTCVTIKLAEQ